MDETDSFDRLRGRLREGDEDAAAEVVRRLAARLNALARAQLDTWVRRKVDPEDVTQSVFLSFFTRYEAGRFDVASWDELWRLLAVIAAHKCTNRAVYFGAKRRNAGAEVPLSDPEHGSADNGRAIDPGPTPYEAAVLGETVEQLLRGLDNDDRSVVELSLQGWTTREISGRLGLSERTVRRFREHLKARLESMRAEAAAEA